MESFFLAVKVKTHQTQFSQNRVGHEKVFKNFKDKVFGKAKNDYSIKARFCLFLTRDKKSQTQNYAQKNNLGNRRNS
jgi:hypothetical protein